MKPLTQKEERVRAAVQELHAALRAQYGADFSYTIMGYGAFVATSNMVDLHKGWAVPEGGFK